jgi:hypothetical protein
LRPKVSLSAPVVGAGEDSADGDGEDVAQQVPFAAVDTGVFETAKVLVQGQTGQSHEFPP